MKGASRGMGSGHFLLAAALRTDRGISSSLDQRVSKRPRWDLAVTDAVDCRLVDPYQTADGGLVQARLDELRDCVIRVHAEQCMRNRIPPSTPYPIEVLY